ncbi:hypothetical protein BWI17_14730 [Betaproteobacteria bacterium GR16-43]|nr:hypothetical protein BWI17_14730 [Betaproteobacteria bacterium GR16-43]
MGPHRTGTTYIQYAAHRNRALLAKHGIQFINDPAQADEMARALVRLDPQAALALFDRLVASAKAAFPVPVPEVATLYSSETLCVVPRELRNEYERGFAAFIAGLEERGYTVELIFVERDLEDTLTSNALLQTSIGNLEFVSPDPLPFVHYLRGYSAQKMFFFERFKVVHLDFAHLASGGDLFANFLKLAYGVTVAGLEPIDTKIDAHNSTSDEQLARGLVMAPVINWLEQFGSVSRFDLFNASQPFAPPIPEATWAEVADEIPLLRDCMRVTARRALELFAAGGSA